MPKPSVVRAPRMLAAAAALLCACREPPVAPSAQAEVVGGPPSPPASVAERDDGKVGAARVIARNPLGVPLHPEPRSGKVSGRLLDGSEVRVLESTDDGRWHHVRARDGISGWITRRYLELSASSDASAPSASSRDTLELPKDSPWASAESCRRVLGEGRRAARTPGNVRIATWNLRWFPDGGPGRRPNPNREQATDLEWLACAIAWLDVDVVAVQEIKLYAGARERLATLQSALDRHTRGSWQAHFDRCPIEAGQHVGFVFDARRVSADRWTTYTSLNPHGQPCKDQLRPGFGGYFRFRGGFDAHLITAHLKAGGRRRDLDLRAKSLRGITTALAEARALVADDDVLIAGDLNTMGCPECSPPVAAAEELLSVERLLGTGGGHLRRVAADGTCSEYFQGRGVLLDHFLASSGLRELGRETRARVAGYCAETGCRVLESRQMPSAHHRLSDHCPLVLELRDEDLD